MTSSAVPALASEASRIEPGGHAWRYYALFLASGFPALLYQIVWQRTLFTLYGVNIESVTVIVTVFMLGLGLGSLAGGRLSIVTGINLVRAFGVIEISIGVFGYFSLSLFHGAAQYTAGASTAVTGVVSFILLLVPTLLMGSTLPLLVANLVGSNENVGRSVGSLYAVNTLGSGVACLFASMFLMRILGESGSVLLAACLNLIVGSTAVLIAFRSSSSPPDPVREIHPTTSVVHSTISTRAGMLMSGAAGFIALAYEILWYHIYSFTSGGTASCFAMLLAFYLVGVAYGSLAVHDLCRHKLKNNLVRTLRAASIVVSLANVAAFLVVPVAAFAVSTAHIPYSVTFSFVAIAAALLGSTFPILCHASIDPNSSAGRKLSHLYLGNIIGSTLGSYIIGFVVLDHLSTETTSLLLLICGFLMALILAMLARPLSIRRILIGSFATCVTLALCSHPLFSGIFERLMLKGDYRPGRSFRNLVENRSGIIAVDKDERVYGGGVYDGQFNIDPISDTNGIFRVYATAALHPNPRHALIIGLSSGSWAQVLVNHPKVEDAEIVEINPGYLPLIQERPVLSSLLHNPKVRIHIDDGRRWLVSHPDSKFDFVLMNTTFNWRANTTNLLSVEFLRLLREHLNPGGIVYYNTTDSGRVQFTGASVFPYALRVANFLAVSDTPINFNRETYRTILENFSIDGRPVFDLSNPVHRARIEQMVTLPLSDHEIVGSRLDESIEGRTTILRRLNGLRLITDDNMGTEW